VFWGQFVWLVSAWRLPASGQFACDGGDKLGCIVRRGAVESGNIFFRFSVGGIAEAPDNDERYALLPAGLSHGGAFHIGSFGMHVLPEPARYSAAGDEDISRYDRSRDDMGFGPAFDRFFERESPADPLGYGDQRIVGWNE
jgi:hypothetical protein